MDDHPLPEDSGFDPLPYKPPLPERDNLDLALRLLVGLLALGGDEASRRLQEMQRKLNEDPALWRDQAPSGDKSLRRKAWHLGIGLARRGRRRVHKNLRRGYELSQRMMARASSASARVRNSRLTAPVREPLEARLTRWGDEAARIVQEGELEEKQGRALALGALSALFSEIMEEASENPELVDFVQDMVSQQSMGMATSAVDNARSVTLTADDAAEGLLRWLLRRTPRRDLPPSPVVGQPQTMYARKIQVEEGDPDD